MDNVIINISEQNEDIRGCFDTETPTLDKILDVLDAKVGEIKELKMTIKELQEPYNPNEDFMYISKVRKEEK